MSGEQDYKISPRATGEELFGRYRIESKIADGGMSSVYRCRDIRTKNTVALKILHQLYVDKAVVRTRFLDEGRLQQMLDHPNIVDVYDVVERDGLLAICMAYVDGPTLEEHLDSTGPMALQTILELTLPVLSAIGFAHSKGVIHRDIKPRNILLDPRDDRLVPKVMDFGVAKLMRGKDLTATGTTVGTLHYMSPEQIIGSKTIDGRADIYSLGCTIYKLCTGEVPFNASTEFALMMAQVEAPATPPSEIASVSPGLEAVVMRCLAKRPDGRYRSIRDLTTALLALRDTVPDKTLTDRITLPAELLDHALEANEVAVDRTGVIDAAALDEIGMIGPTREERQRVMPDDQAQDPTVEMRIDPSIDRRDTDVTVESLLKGVTTAPLSAASQAEPGIDVTEPRQLSSAELARAEDRAAAAFADRPTDEFQPLRRRSNGVDSRERTRPRAASLAHPNPRNKAPEGREAPREIWGHSRGEVEREENGDLDETKRLQASNGPGQVSEVPASAGSAREANSKQKPRVGLPAALGEQPTPVQKGQSRGKNRRWEWVVVALLLFGLVFGTALAFFLGVI